MTWCGESHPQWGRGGRGSKSQQASFTHATEDVGVEDASRTAYGPE